MSDSRSEKKGITDGFYSVKGLKKQIVFNGFIWASQIRAYSVIVIPKRTQYWLDSYNE